MRPAPESGDRGVKRRSDDLRHPRGRRCGVASCCVGRRNDEITACGKQGGGGGNTEAGEGTRYGSGWRRRCAGMIHRAGRAATWTVRVFHGPGAHRCQVHRAADTTGRHLLAADDLAGRQTKLGQEENEDGERAHRVQRYPRRPALASDEPPESVRLRQWPLPDPLHRPSTLAIAVRYEASQEKHRRKHAGHIKGYVPGVRENGAQYTHAAVSSVIAFAMLGDRTKATELLGMLNPITHAKTPRGGQK